jgi:hypothetical protein
MKVVSVYKLACMSLVGSRLAGSPQIYKSQCPLIAINGPCYTVGRPYACVNIPNKSGPAHGVHLAFCCFSKRSTFHVSFEARLGTDQGVFAAIFTFK